MKIVIVTGMSGAGKATALNILEDEGFYCVANMPVSLITTFAQLAADGRKGYDNIALGIDIRNGQGLTEMDYVLSELSEKNIEYTIIYLDAADDVLIKRFKETRRSHPLAKDARVETGIVMERGITHFLKEKANYIIDTSQMLTRELKQQMLDIFLSEKKYANLFVTVLSFGFKYGIPSDADLVFDVRFLPNPYYVEELKHLTGNDKPIQDFVMNNDVAKEFLDRTSQLVKFLLPNYVKEGKNSLVIAFGCTGGKHRSVTLANAIAEKLNETEFGCKVEHRDIDKDSKRKK